MFLLNAVTAITTGSTVTLGQARGGSRMIAQAGSTDPADTFTIVLEGRLSTNMGWATLATLTNAAPIAAEIPSVPLMRARVTAYTRPGSGTLSCEVQE